jgi:transcriptional regulator with XRE-family HTH domain
VPGPQYSVALSLAGKPGDLGSQVSRRRQELKLSRAELAELTGVSVPYLTYVETQPTRPTQAALQQPAGALQTRRRRCPAPARTGRQDAAAPPADPCFRRSTRQSAMTC